MFRLDNLLEEWATIYKPMHHDPSATAAPADKAFFTIDRFDLQNEWQRTFSTLNKPALLYCTTIEAQLSKTKPTFVDYQHDLYIVCKQRKTANYETDEEGAHYAKLDLNEMVLDLLAFLFTLHDFANGRSLPADTPDAVRTIAINLDREQMQGLKGLRLDDTQWWSAPRYKNGWWVLGVELQGMEARPLCVTPEKYT